MSTNHPVPDPTARLTAAAAHLRTLLTNPQLTPGPWLSLDHGDRLLRNQPGDEDRAPVYVIDEPMSNGANADYIEVMDPVVGVAIVAVLEQAAKSHQATLTAAGMTWASVTDPRAVAWVEEMTDTHALALADAILGPTEDDASAPALRTPCSFPGCDTGPGEPCERHEREQAHTEGDHELCGPDCQAAAVASLVAGRATAEAAAQLAPLTAAVREQQAQHDAKVRAAGRRDGLLEGAAALQAVIDRNARFAARSQSHVALRGAREILLNLISQDTPPAADTLPEWLCQRFSGLDPAAPFPEVDRAYWENQAAAVRRAVTRGGFKQPTPCPNRFRQLVDDVAAQLHDENPAAYHGDGGPGDCKRCADQAAGGGQ